MDKLNTKSQVVPHGICYLGDGVGNIVDGLDNVLASFSEREGKTARAAIESLLDPPEAVEPECECCQWPLPHDVTITMSGVPDPSGMTMLWGGKEFLIIPKPEKLTRKERAILVLSRKKYEQIVIGKGKSQIVITLIDIRGDKCRFGIEAPPEIPVHRREVHEAIRKAERERKDQ